MASDLERRNADFVLRHFEEFVNGKDPSAAERNFSADFVDRNPPGGISTVAEGVMLARRVYERFPDMRFRAEDVLAQGDKVVVRSIWSGRDSVDGVLKEFHSFTLWRLLDGEIAERWATTADMKPVDGGSFVW